MSIDLETIVFKLYNFFSIYTIRVESLKEFCDFVNIEYKSLLSHSKTRWLSLYPAVNRLLQVYPALKAYFLSLDNCPHILKQFFESNFSEAYLYFAHSLMFVIHEDIKKIEAEQNSILEVKRILNSLSNMLLSRFDESFLPLKVKSILSENRKNGFDREVESFKLNCINCYKKSYDYLILWCNQLAEFDCFSWMALDDVPKWEDVEKTICYLDSKSVYIDDSKCFDQFCNLKVFVEKNLIEKKSFSCHKWVDYFKCNSNLECHSELLKMCQFFYAIPGQNANVERIFSMINGQWTKERNRLKMSTVKGILTIAYNYKNVPCGNFYDEIKDNEQILNRISGAAKYKEDNEDDDDDQDE